MRTKISAIYPEQLEKASTHTNPELHIVDFTLSTSSQRGVECLHEKPEGVESFLIVNESNLPILFVPFDKNTFVDDARNSLTQCECFLSPEEYQAGNWRMFVETKYCKRRNNCGKILDAKDQLIATLGYYREGFIISNNELVHLFISLPNEDEIPFVGWRFSQDEISEVRFTHKAILVGTNKVVVKNSKSLIYED